MTLKKIGIKIANRRSELNLTQKDLAEVINSTQAEVSKIERGESNITITSLNKYCSALKLKFKLIRRK